MQQQQGRDLGVAREARDDDDGKLERRREKRRHQQEKGEISNEIYCSDSGDHSYHNASAEDYEGPRPAKRRRRPSPADSDVALTPPYKRSPTPRLGRLNSLTPPVATQDEIFAAQSQAGYGCPLSPIDGSWSMRAQTSRTPSLTAESMPAADAVYEEWPLQGFLKRTKIGNQITFNLEFNLKHLPEVLELSIPSEALGISSDGPASSRRAVAHSKMHGAALTPQIKGAPWTAEEDATLLDMRKRQGRSWDDIQAAFPNRSKATIQVRYSTKLRNRAFAGGNNVEGRAVKEASLTTSADEAEEALEPPC